MHQSPSASERASALWHRARRHRSRAQGRVVEAICQHDLPGFAVGGVAVGERPEQIAEVVAFTAPRLPAQKPRYLMGVGYEQDIVHAVRSGIDMFDCVLPTRNARNAQAFTRSGRMNLKNAKFAEDDAPIDASCDCATCMGATAGLTSDIS